MSLVKRVCNYFGALEDERKFRILYKTHGSMAAIPTKSLEGLNVLGPLYIGRQRILMAYLRLNTIMRRCGIRTMFKTKASVDAFVSGERTVYDERLVEIANSDAVFQNLAILAFEIDGIDASSYIDSEGNINEKLKLGLEGTNASLVIN